MTLPKYLTTITPFSKYLTMGLFLIFPFIAFYLGIQYQIMITPSYPPTQYIAPPEMQIVPHRPHVVIVTATPPVSKVQTKFCTQEAKQCPNGSYVSRTGPNCEFTACPK
jgi:hypothetical protein